MIIISVHKSRQAVQRRCEEEEWRRVLEVAAQLDLQLLGVKRQKMSTKERKRIEKRKWTRLKRMIEYSPKLVRKRASRMRLVNRDN